MARIKDSFQSIGERESFGVVSTGSDIWRGTAGTIPIPDQTTGEQMTLVSTSANDTSAGTGVQQVFIHYLDGSWDMQTETVTLNGTTPVNTVATDIKFVNDIHAAVVGTNGAAAGTITIYRTGTASRVYDLLTVGTNMSLTNRKMIPADFDFYLDRWSAAATGGNKPVFIRIRSTDHHGILYDGANPVFLFKDVVNLEAGGTYVREWSKSSRVKMPARSIIKVSAWATANGTNVSSSWEGELISTT